MGIHVNIGEAKTRLSELVAASLRGEEVILAKSGVPVARIVAIEEAQVDARAKRKALREAWVGSLAGKLPPNAGDDLLKPTMTDEEVDALRIFPDDDPPA